MPQTIAHMAHEQEQRLGDRVVFHYQQGGRWVSSTWRQTGERARDIGAGLWELGCRHGDRVAIVSESRHEWSTADLAILGLGGIVVGIYPASTAEQVQYILEHSQSRIALVENAEQLDKLAQVRSQLPGLEAVVVFDPPEQAGDRAQWLSLDELCERGRALRGREPELGEQCMDAVKPDDVATIVYTSGTTGPPKGAVLTHSSLCEIADIAARALGLGEDDVGVVFLPLAHSLQRVTAYAGLGAGVTGWFAPSLEQLPETLQAAQPTVLQSVPRLFEKIHTRILGGVAEQPVRRQKLFAAAMAVGRKHSALIRGGERVPLYLRLAHAAVDRVIFSRVRARVFGSRIRFLISGGAPISAELLEFFHAMGLLILEGYGLTETSAPATVNLPYAYRFGTVGRPLPQTEVRIADDGEVLIRGPGVFREYYQDAEATAQAFEPEGWFRSGDIGELDADGYLRITDRKKDLIVTAGGKNIAPQNIENLLKTDPHISQVVVHGDKRKHLVALVTLDAEQMQSWARAHGREDLDPTALAQDEAVQQMVRQIIETTNRELPRYEQIKKHRIVAEDFSVENGMLTPTLKVRRREIESCYRELLDEMYGE